MSKKKKNNKNKRKNSKKNSNLTKSVTKVTKKEVIKEEKQYPKILAHIFNDTFNNNLLFMTFIIFLIEILFRALNKFEFLAFSTLRIFISVFFFSLIITFISRLFSRKWIRNTISLLFIFIYSVYSWIQIGFINYLGVYISFNTTSQFGAVKDYISDYLLSFKLIYYILYIPFILAIIYYLIILRKKDYSKIVFHKKSWQLIFIPLMCGLIYFSTLVIPFMQNKYQIKNNVKLFINPDVPSIAVNQFGTAMFGLLDLKSYLFPVEVEEKIINASQQSSNQNVSREVSDALQVIAEEETNKKYINLNNYFASQKVTDYNEYTGMFAGKNVVIVLMESVNEAIINEEYYPNFTKLYNEGWHWENNYSPRNSCATGNNEFSAMTGLFSIYNTCTANVYKNNTYFEAIFNLFNNKGYVTNSMHDFTEWYYYRKTIHPNMGSMKYYGADALGIKTSTYGEWPSDVEFFEKAFDIILNREDNKPFMTWLTTVSSHQPFSVSSTNGDLYLKYFKEQGYSTTVSRYMSKLKVVDNAIGVMIDKLKEAGELDNTLIVLLADHYPYGLNNKYISEMIDHDLDDYERERTPLVMYNSKMTPKTFKEYNFYVNLLPTIANLMNLDYDPRLYMGTDVLSPDYESRVVFADGSWKNEIAYYNASTSKIKYYTDVTYTEEELQQINNEISLKIQMSSSAIKNNYFKYLNEKISSYEEGLLNSEDSSEVNEN